MKKDRINLEDLIVAVPVIAFAIFFVAVMAKLIVAVLFN